MKKILFTLLLLLSTAIGWAQTYINVATLDELKNALKDPYAKIKLTADIDIRGLKDEDTPLCNTFSGVIDGSYTEQVGDSTVYCHHKIYGGINTYKTETIDGKEVRKVTSRPTTDWNRSPLFDKLDNATIKDVAFCNMKVKDNDDKDEAGIIASRAVNQCAFMNITMDYCYIDSDEHRAGTMFGYAENCTFQHVSLQRCAVYVNGVEGGGFVGHSNHCTYEVCTTSFDTGVFVDGQDYYFGYGANAAWAGGFVGYSVSDTFTGCINAAFVGADQSQVGGYTGVSKYSNFTDCINVGTVAHIDRSDFTGKRYDRNKALDDHELTSAELGWLVGGLTSVSLETAFIVSQLVSEEFRDWFWLNVGFGLFRNDWGQLYSFFAWNTNRVTWFGSKYNMATPVFSEIVSFSVASVIVLVAISVAIEVAIQIYTGDDEVGGISGFAQGGTFERCQNYVELKCRDDNCGGIVGLGRGVTINNCFNSGDADRDEDDTTGTILGAAEADPDNGGKKCKVTNCLSTDAYHIVGDYDYDKGMDPASGNNYRVGGKKYNGKSVRCEEAVTDAQIKSGLVSWWLNQGVENRSIGAKPWRQGIMENIEKYNVMDPRNPEVKIEDLEPFEIGTAEDLRLFANAVNAGQKFLVGVLTADIDWNDLGGYPWIPIGMGENYSFRGIFDGQGHTISGLECSTDADLGASLFGVVHAGAEIRNVTVKNSTFSHANDYGAAGIVGRISLSWWGNVVIENCASYADVSAKKCAGGILGHVSSEDVPNVHVYVENCVNGGTITADGSSALLCGYVGRTGHISSCWSAGQLKAKGTTAPFNNENTYGNECEYLVGYNKNSDIKNCGILNAAGIIDGYKGDMQVGVSDYDPATLISGEFTLMLNDYTNDVTKGLTWQQNLGTDETPVPGNKGVYHTRTVSNEYGTACLPYALKSDDNIRYYTFQESSDANGVVTLNFNYAETVWPGIPVLFKVAEPGEVTISDAYDGWSYGPMPLSPDTWNFKGTYEQQTFEGEAAKSIYYVSGGKIKNGKKATIAPYRAYFEGPSIETLGGSNGARVRIMIDGEEDETAALQLVTDDFLSAGEATYTLYGTKAGEGYRGIVIRGGKKVMVNN